MPSPLTMIIMASLDLYVNEPSGKREYLQNWGYHFSKKAYQWATSMMRKKDDSGNMVEVKPYTQDQVDEMLKKYGIRLDNNKGYDAAYLASMVKADMWGSSIEDELHMCRYLKDVLDDPDGTDQAVFMDWYFKMIKKGIPVLWEEIM